MTIPDTSVREIYDHWMKYKVRGNVWKGCKYVCYVKNDIRARLKDVDGDTELAKQAIDHYAKMLLDSDYTWDYVWTLHEFFTRKRKDGGLQFLRFIEINPEDYRTKKAKAAMFNKVKRERAAADQARMVALIRESPLAKVKEMLRVGTERDRWLIRKVRPEAVC